MCFGISSSGNASSNVGKAVRNSHAAKHTKSCFIIFRLNKFSSFQLKLYFCEEFLIMKGAIASLRNCGRII